MRVGSWAGGCLRTLLVDRLSSRSREVAFPLPPRSPTASVRRSTSVVRKIGLPWQPELAIGAVAEGNVCVMNDAVIEEAGVRGDELEGAIARERVELERRVHAYRGEQLPIPLDGRLVILVDDGLATGYTARAAIEQIRRRGASRVVLAVPVAPEDSVATMGRVADEFVALQTPTWFLSIGEHYEDFRQTSDDEVVACLQRATKPAIGQVAEVPGRA